MAPEIGVPQTPFALVQSRRHEAPAQPKGSRCGGCPGRCTGRRGSPHPKPWRPTALTRPRGLGQWAHPAHAPGRPGQPRATPPGAGTPPPHLWPVLLGAAARALLPPCPKRTHRAGKGQPGRKGPGAAHSSWRAGAGEAAAASPAVGARGRRRAASRQGALCRPRSLTAPPAGTRTRRRAGGARGRPR